MLQNREKCLMKRIIVAFKRKEIQKAELKMEQIKNEQLELLQKLLIFTRRRHEI